MDSRFFKTRFVLPALFASCFATHALYASQEIIQTVIAPSCFVENSSLEFKELAKMENFLLIQAKLTDLESVKEKNATQPCRFFRDVSEDWQTFSKTKKVSVQQQKNLAKSFLSDELTSIKYNKLNSDFNVAAFNIQYQEEVETVLKSFVKERLWADLQTLTSFQNRYALADTGVKAAEWFKGQAEALAVAANRSDITVQTIKTGSSYKQPSVLVKIPGTDPKLEGVLLGGHMDTLSGTKPGADDDGTGAVTVLESLRTVLNSGMKFKRTMYFVWYAAEEQGLIGSSYVVKYFTENKIPLVGALQLDMTGYQRKAENRIWIVDDYVDTSLSTFVSSLAVNYAKTQVSHTQCGYACSDHASWYSKGYRSAIPFESKFGEDSPYIHTANDTISTVSLDHMARFAIIGISFMSELADPVK